MQRRQPQQPAPQPPPPNEWAVLKADLDRNRAVYADLLGGKTPAPEAKVDRFIMSCYQVVWHKPDLIKADRDSLLLAFAEAASVGLDLSPTSKETFIEIRKGLARFSTQYQGLITLMHRGADIDFIHTGVVRKGDRFRHIGGSDPRLEHEACELGSEPPDYDSDESILAAYAVVQLKGSSRPHFEVARRSDLEKARALSRGNVWGAWYERMAIKVPLRRLANKIPGADEARQVLAVESHDEDQPDGRVLTMPRVSERMGLQAGSAAPAIGPQNPDELRALMASSGSSDSDRSQAEQPEEAR